MSSSPSVSHYFIRVALKGTLNSRDEVLYPWYMHDVAKGARLNKHVLHAEAVRAEDTKRIMTGLCAAFRGIVGYTLVPCTNDVLTDAQKRLIHVV